MTPFPVVRLAQSSYIHNFNFCGCHSDGKESACNAGDLGSVPGSGKSSGGGYGWSILAGESPWTEEPDGLYSPWGCRESDTTE